MINNTTHHYIKKTQIFAYDNGWKLQLALTCKEQMKDIKKTKVNIPRNLLYTLQCQPSSKENHEKYAKTLEKMKTLREEELLSTPNPSVFIDYSKTKFLVVSKA